MSLINRIMPEFRHLMEPFGRLRGPLLSQVNDPFRDAFEFRQPAVDIKETEKEYLVEAEVPGLKKEDLEVQVRNDSTLVIGGRFSSEKNDENPESRDWLKERVDATFRRTLEFPTALNAEHLKASLKDGILSIRIPKEESRVNRVLIE